MAAPIATADANGIAGTRERLEEIENRRRALSALNGREFTVDPARLRANQAAIETDSARRRAALKAETDSVYADLRRHLLTGGPDGGPAVTLPAATIMSRLSEAQQDAVTAQVNDAIEGRKPSTDAQTWYAIRRGLMDDDADERQRWAAKNLAQFMGRLSGADFAELEKLQASVRASDGGAEQSRLQIIARAADNALRSLGIDPTARPGGPPDSDAAQAARFHRALQDELSGFESSKGRKATASEAYEIVNGLKDTGLETGWLERRDRPASVEVASDHEPTDPAFHEPGAQLAQAEPLEPPPQHGFRIGLAPDFETFQREMEEYRQREAAERSAAIPAGSNGAPVTEPYPGSTEYEAADAQARDIAAEQTEDASAGTGSAPPTEPPPGSPEYRAAEAEARKLDAGAWENLGLFGQLGVAFRHFDQESRKSAAAIAVDSNARRQAKVSEIQEKARTTPDELDLAEKRYLHRNRNAASDLAGAVVRLVDAQRHLDELPTSDPMRRLSQASSVAEAARLLRDHPGEIARAIGVESLPADGRRQSAARVQMDFNRWMY